MSAEVVRLVTRGNRQAQMQYAADAFERVAEVAAYLRNKLKTGAAINEVTEGLLKLEFSAGQAAQRFRDEAKR